MDDPTLASILASGLPPDEAAATLVGLALEAGGRDNVTAVIVDVVSVPAFDDASTDRNSQKLRALRELAFDGPDTSPRDPHRTPTDGAPVEEPSAAAGGGLIAAIPGSRPAVDGAAVDGDRAAHDFLLAPQVERALRNADSISRSSSFAGPMNSRPATSHSARSSRR